MSGVVRKTYRCELLTPMIMSGADQSKAELRAPSIKGALRWWWRALNPTPPGADGKYHDLRAKEYAIFGGVHGEVAQKSKVSLHVAWETPESELVEKSGDDQEIANWVPTKAGGQRPDSSKPITFLAFGAYQMGDSTARTLILPKTRSNKPTSFLISFKCDAAFWDEIEPAIKAMLTFGGFGLKHRNGFGQVSYSVRDAADSTSIFISDKFDKTEFVQRFLLKRKSGVGYAAITGNTLLREYAAKLQTWESIVGELGEHYMKAKKLIGEATGEKNEFAAHSPHMWTSHDRLNAKHWNKKHGLARLDKCIQLFVAKEEDNLVYGFLSLPYEVQVSGAPLASQTIDVKAKGGGWKKIDPPEKDRIEVVKEFMKNLPAS